METDKTNEAVQSAEEPNAEQREKRLLELIKNYPIAEQSLLTEYEGQIREIINKSEVNERTLTLNELKKLRELGSAVKEIKNAWEREKRAMQYEVNKLKMNRLNLSL